MEIDKAQWIGKAKDTRILDSLMKDPHVVKRMEEVWTWTSREEKVVRD